MTGHYLVFKEGAFSMSSSPSMLLISFLRALDMISFVSFEEEKIKVFAPIWDFEKVKLASLLLILLHFKGL